MGFDTIIINLVAYLVFLQEPGAEIHGAKCLRQECDQSSQVCGEAKFEELFNHISEELGSKQLEVFQHIKIIYIKPDGSNVS